MIQISAQKTTRYVQWLKITSTTNIMDNQLTTLSDELKVPHNEESKDTTLSDDIKASKTDDDKNATPKTLRRRKKSKTLVEVPFSPIGFAISFLAGVWSADEHKWAQDVHNKSLLMAKLIEMMQLEPHYDYMYKIYDAIKEKWKKYEKKYNPSDDSSESES